MSRPNEREALYALLNEGLALYPAQPFLAHERWEEAWLVLPDSDERTLLRSLIQLAAARIKAAQGNARGLEKSLDKAARGFAQIDQEVGALCGLDLGRLGAALEAGQLPTLPPRVHRRGILYLHGFASGPTTAKADAFRQAFLDAPLCCPDLNLSAPTPAQPEPHFDFFGLTVPRALMAARRSLFEETIVVGSSMGGYLAALLGADPRVQALILMAPAFDFSARLLERHGAEEVARWRREGFAMIDHHQTRAPERLARRSAAPRAAGVPPITADLYPPAPRRDGAAVALEGVWARYRQDEPACRRDLPLRVGEASPLVELDLDDDHRLDDRWGARSSGQARVGLRFAGLTGHFDGLRISRAI
jgi:predicted esterase YcpF (UPF0227 family)